MLKLAIDFDGTIVTHAYPHIGDPVPQALQWLDVFRKTGDARLMLWTMRSGTQLEEAIQYCRTYGVEFDSINRGIGDWRWTMSPKMHADIYIDDAAFGCPLIRLQNKRPFVDWSIVGPAILKEIQKGI